METKALDTYGIYAFERPITTPTSWLEDLVVGKNHYHSYLALVNESSHRVIEEVHFNSLNKDGKHLSGPVATAHNGLNFYACRLGVQDAFRKASSMVGLQEHQYQLAAQFKTRDVPVPENRQSSMRLRGNAKDIRIIWDKAVCADANKLTNLAVPFRPTGNASKPAMNCRTATKFLLERIGSTLPNFPLEIKYPLMKTGRNGATKLHQIFTAHYHGTTTPANDATPSRFTPAHSTLKRAMK